MEQKWQVQTVTYVVRMRLVWHLEEGGKTSIKHYKYKYILKNPCFPQGFAFIYKQ